MRLSIDEVKALIKKGEPAFIAEAKKKHKSLEVHVNGRGVQDYLKQVDNYENGTQYELRKKFAMSTKYVIANIMRPSDKVFSAKGGSKVYNIQGSEQQTALLKTKVSKVRSGLSVHKWIKKVQSNKFIADPSGIVFFEVTEDGKETYPVLKSIDSIRNYDLDGRAVEWVLFEPVSRVDETGQPLDGKFFRFVDDEKDIVIKSNDDLLTHLEDEDYKHPWVKLPAIVNSDVINDSLLYNDSILDVIVELADKYLRTNTIKSIHEFLHGFPFFWMFAQNCESCKGQGELGGKECATCNGSGKSMKRDVSDAFLLNPPKNKDAPNIAPDLAGYVTPPLEIPQEQRAELSWLWGLMHYSVWGTTYEPQSNETATAAFLDVQPVNDRLNDISDSFEDMEQRIVDILGEFYLKAGYKGSSINYGRRFLMESPDKIWDKYISSKEKKAPQSSLTNLLNQYYQSEYQNNAEELTIMTKATRLEPFIHYDLFELKGTLSEEEFKNKLYFPEWWKSLNENDMLSKDINSLTKDFEKFVSSKKVSITE